MLATMPGVFSIDPTNLTISHLASNIADRISLFGTNTYSFVGSFATSQNSPNFPPDVFNLVVDFIDACRTATVVPQSITLANVNERDDSSFVFSAFDDSIDVTVTPYPLDICGEKTVTLVSPPGFLSVLNGSDLNSFSIEYTARTIVSDLGNHLIDYKVEITQYAAIATSLTSSTSLTVECSGIIDSFIEDPYTSSAIQLDLLTDTTVQKALPTVTYFPDFCTTLTWSVYRTNDGSEMLATMPSVFYIADASATDLTIAHIASDFSVRKELYGQNDFYFVGRMDDTASHETVQIPFVIEFQDACRTATVVS